MPPRQRAPWASGKHGPSARRKPPRTAAAKVASRVWANAKSNYAKATRKHPWMNLILQLVLGLVFVVTLVFGSVLQTFLYYLVLALSGLGQLAIVRARQMERDRQAAKPPPRPTKAGPKMPPPPPKGSDVPPPTGGLRCTATGRSLEGDDPCDCKSRHVRKQSNADRRGVPLGYPYGKPK